MLNNLQAQGLTGTEKKVQKRRLLTNSNLVNIYLVIQENYWQDL
jgi:hypothetical protein